MTKLLDQALEVVRQMPPADQDNIAHAMISMAKLGADPGEADPDELHDALEGLAQVDRGEIATKEQIEAAFRRFRR